MSRWWALALVFGALAALGSSACVCTGGACRDADGGARGDAPHDARTGPDWGTYEYPDYGPPPYYRDAGMPDYGRCTRSTDECSTSAPCDVDRACGCPTGQHCDIITRDGFYLGDLPFCDGPGTSYGPALSDSFACHAWAWSGEVGAMTCDVTLASDDPARAGWDGCSPCLKCVMGPAGRRDLLGPGCFPRCTPSATDRGGCSAGERCDSVSHTCRPDGCATDRDCRTVYEDADHDGAFSGPGDRVCIDASGPTCDVATARCRHPGASGARAGDACTRDTECEEDGDCLDVLSAMPGGYCTRRDCDVVGCASASDRCVSIGDARLCVGGCTVGADVVDALTGIGGHGSGCRAGYACTWDGASAAGAPGGGYCWPGNYDDVPRANLGHACTSDTQCWSPYGAGRCVEGACTIVDCAAYAAVLGVCGAGGTCARIPGGTSACLVACTSADDCTAATAPPGTGCIDASSLAPDGVGRVCWPGCASDANCAAPYVCVGATATSLGRCT